MSHVVNTDTMGGKENIHFIGGAIVDEYLWTTALEWNGYYKINVETGYAEFLGLFDYVDSLADKLFSQVLVHNKFVFFVPWFFDYLVRVDTETLDIRYWMLPENITREIAKFRAAYIYNGRIVMFPHVGDDICIFDIEKGEFKCCRNWIKELDKYKLKNKKDKFLQGCQVGEIAYIANSSDRFIMKYNLHNDTYEIILFPESEKAIFDVEKFDNNYLLILTAVGNVWKYNIIKDSRELIYQYRGKTKSPYGHVIAEQNCFYLIPAKESNIKFFDGKKEIIVPYPDDWKLHYINVNIETIFNGYLRNENEILLYPCLGNKLLKIKPGQRTVLDLDIHENIKDRAEEVRKRILSSGMCTELLYEPKSNLDLYLSIVNEKGEKAETTKRPKIIGLEIWDKMKGF